MLGMFRMFGMFEIFGNVPAGWKYSWNVRSERVPDRALADLVQHALAHAVHQQRHGGADGGSQRLKVAARRAVLVLHQLVRQLPRARRESESYTEWIPLRGEV